MIQVHQLRDGLELYKVLGSEVRLGIVKLLARKGDTTLGELGSELGVSPAALTPHIHKLQSLGLIQVERQEGTGSKVCSLAVSQVLLDVSPSDRESTTRIYESSVSIGSFSDWKASAPCGAVSQEEYLFRDEPDRCGCFRGQDLQLLWFTDGWIEYRIPNLLPDGNRLLQLTVSFEMSSTLLGSDPSQQCEVHFSLNDLYLGEWVTFPSSGSTRGIYTPSWWTSREMQHGFLKMLVINHNGVFLDGKQIRSFPLYEDLPFVKGGEMTLRLSTSSAKGHGGGLALYGSAFGNYPQGITARIHSMPEEANYMGENRDAAPV